MSPSITRFVIVATPRTGSNYLCGGLDAHPEVVCHYELFHPDRIYATWELAAELGDLAARNADPAAFLARVWSLHRGAKAVGFKIFLDHDRTGLKLVLDDPGVRKIVLKRRNRIKAFVSEGIATRTGVYQRLEGEPAPPAPVPPIHVDPAALLRDVERRRRFYRTVEKRLRGTDQRYLEVHYEDLIARPEVRSAILHYLGVAADPSLFRPRDRKQNPDDLRLLIANFAALDRALARRSLRADLHDAPPAP
ncbi:MAG: hypothetical protein AB1726_09335 [Planctomycetota bacterium]